jgi:nuclear receptor interaction protein
MPMDDDSDDVSEDDDDEDDEMDEDEGVDEDDEDDYGGMDADPLSDMGECGDVEKILPRRCFKGARNVRTVKDCE